jgi:ABC-2 type transport system ATP-binding protein
MTLIQSVQEYNMEITITRLTKHYGKVRALEEVSLQIGGGMFGLLGPNGAGKTTLMRIITTLVPPTAGKVSVGGADVMKDPGSIRQQLGYLPQEFGFYKSLNAYEMLDYIAVMKNIPPKQRKSQVNNVLEAVNLQNTALRRVGGFSGGMKQRLGIAQALLGDPQLLVVDEPTAGLDPEERIRFRNLLARLSRERTVLLSTHIVADIEASCSGMAVLDRGD